GLILDYLNQGLAYLQVAGLEAEIKTISFLSDGVELSADLYFPGKEAAVEVGRLRISRSEGMSLTGYILIGGMEIEIDELEITSDKLVLNYGRAVFPEYFSPSGVRFEPKKSAIAPLKHTSRGLDLLALPEEDPDQSPPVIASSNTTPARQSFNEGGKQSHKVSTRSFISGEVEDRGVNYPGSFSAFLYRLSNEEPSEGDQLIDISVVGPDGRYDFSDLPSGDYAVKMTGRITVEIIGLEIGADGFHLVSGEVTDIPDLEYADMILAVGSLGFSTEPPGAELNDVELLLPQILGGGTVSLELLRVTAQGVDVVGEVNDFSFTIPNSGFGLSIDEFYFDTLNDRFGGLGSLHAPTLPDIAVGVGFSGREVSWVRAEVQGLNYPIYSVVFLQTVSLEINELETAPPPPIIIAVAGLSAGPTWSIPGTSDSVVLLAADPISLTVDTGDFAELAGTMTLFKPSSGTMTGRISFLGWGWNYSFSGYDLAGVRAHLSRSQGFTASAYLDIIDILKGTSTLSVDRSNRISGGTVGTLQVPSLVPLIGGRRLGGFNSILNNSYLAGEGWASRLLSVAVRFDYDGRIQFGRNLKSLGVNRLLARRLAALAAPGAVLPLSDRIEVPAGMKRAVFRFAWEESETEITLITPDETEITPAGAPLTSEYFNYLLDGENREAWYIVKDPQPGLWGYRLSNTEIGELEVELIELEEPPAIEMAALPAPARGLGPLTSGRTIRLSWNTTSLAGGETISLYYDEEKEGFAGKLIAQDLSADQGWYDWVIDETVPCGHYFIYAVLDNGRTAPSASYMPGTVTVNNPLAPAPPRNLTLSVSGVAVTANWDENLEADLIGYLLEWTDDPGAVKYERRLAVGMETSHTLEQLINGREYKIRVKALNEEGYESLPSESRSVKLDFEPENRAPRIVSPPVTSARADTLYRYQVEARDDDGDDLTYSLTLGPEGMSIAPPAGLIQWTPEANDVGLVEVEVEVSDAASSGRQRFFIEVYNNYMANIAPVITSSPETGAMVGVEYIYQIQAYDLDDDQLAFSLAAAP
ncbi:MAG: putative Ig domain-containing protein, partial [Candidatus Erginobacter occultus]|nr:putative Ig domain-containing protein [Candidatus Erginobacter occultus]